MQEKGWRFSGRGNYLRYRGKRMQGGSIATYILVSGRLGFEF